MFVLLLDAEDKKLFDEIFFLFGESYFHTATQVNELYVELYQGGGTARRTSASRIDLPVEIIDSVNVDHALPGYNENMPPTTGKHLEALQVEPIKNDRNSGGQLNGGHLIAVPNATESHESAEIVQIPLDDVEIGGAELKALNNDENTEVSLSDAPFTGAPLRLVSYFARYISGADLVEQNPTNPV